MKTSGHSSGEQPQPIGEAGALRFAVLSWLFVMLFYPFIFFLLANVARPDGNVSAVVHWLMLYGEFLLYAAFYYMVTGFLWVPSVMILQYVVWKNKNFRAALVPLSFVLIWLVVIISGLGPPLPPGGLHYQIIFAMWASTLVPIAFFPINRIPDRPDRRTIYYDQDFEP